MNTQQQFRLIECMNNDGILVYYIEKLVTAPFGLFPRWILYTEGCWGVSTCFTNLEEAKEKVCKLRKQAAHKWRVIDVECL